MLLLIVLAVGLPIATILTLRWLVMYWTSRPLYVRTPGRATRLYVSSTGRHRPVRVVRAGDTSTPCRPTAPTTGPGSSTSSTPEGSEWPPRPSSTPSSRPPTRSVFGQMPDGAHGRASRETLIREASRAKAEADADEADAAIQGLVRDEYGNDYWPVIV